MQLRSRLTFLQMELIGIENDKETIEVAISCLDYQVPLVMESIGDILSGIKIEDFSEENIE